MHAKKQILFFILGIIGVFLISFIASNILLSNKSSISKLDLKHISNFRLPRAYIVESGSMSPAIPVGAIVFSVPSDSYSIGDVITFHQTPGSKTLVTHRLMARSFPDGVGKPAEFRTSGDANKDFDASSISQDQIVGKVSLSVPYIGYVANFAKKPYGFILLVIVPATIIIYEELKNLGLELNKVFFKFAERFRKKKNEVDLISQNRTLKSSSFLKPAVFVPLFGAALVFTGIASAYFYDNEKSVGNVLQAGTWNSPTSTPNVSPSLTPTITVTLTPTPTLTPTLIPTSIPN